MSHSLTRWWPVVICRVNVCCSVYRVKLWLPIRKCFPHTCPNHFSCQVFIPAQYYMPVAYYTVSYIMALVSPQSHSWCTMSKRLVLDFSVDLNLKCSPSTRSELFLLWRVCKTLRHYTGIEAHTVSLYKHPYCCHSFTSLSTISTINLAWVTWDYFSSVFLC